jgi:hypothetical protein
MPCQTKTYEIKNHSNDMEISEKYLRKEGDEYFLYSLGRNGEPSSRKPHTLHF